METDKKNPRIAFCAANRIGREVIKFVRDFGYPIEFVATCHRDSPEHEEEIAKLCCERGIKSYRKIEANDPRFVEEIRSHSLDLMMLAWWPDIIKKPAIDSVKIGWINMHPSLLPYNRGKHPYYWAINDGTPFGVTLHFIDERTDTGPILFQREIPVGINDTGESLYNKGLKEILDLFKESYGKIIGLDFTPRPQDESRATFHLGKMLDEHSRIDLERDYRASDLINRIRGRTFLGGDSSYFVHDGRKYRVKLIVEEVNRPDAS
jgi:methionyl-tRNA formyltransferase